MRQERGPIHLLVIAEVIILVIVSVLGVAESFKPKEASEFKMEESSENSIPELPAEQEEDSEENSGKNDEEGEASKPEPDENAENEPPAETETFPEEVEAKVSSMTTEEKVAQLFVISPEALTGQEGVTIAGEGTKSALTQYPIGGLVYSNVNYVGDRQSEALLAGAEQFSNERSGLYLWLFAAGDGEDGQLITAMSADYEAKPLTEFFRKADSIRTAQPNETVFFPVHFPENQDMIDDSVFCVIVSNITDASVTGDEGVLCCFSREAVGYLRNTLHYSGLIMTDTLSAEAVASGYSAGEAAVLAIQAGVDLIYQPSDFQTAYQAVLDAVDAGRITAEQLDLAVKHILAKKLFIPAPSTSEGERTADNAGNITGNSRPSSAAGNSADNSNKINQGGTEQQPGNGGGGQTASAGNNPPAESNNPPAENNPPVGNNNPPEENNQPEEGGGEDDNPEDDNKGESGGENDSEGGKEDSGKEDPGVGSKEEP